MDLEFDDDFYHYEEEKGNGVIIKLDSEGDLYKICIDQCNCHVECQYNDDCNDGFVCKDYLCVDESNSLQNRRKKETVGSHTERKVAQVVVTVPLLMCIFGVFSLMSLAVDYGERYYIEECEKTCPFESKEFLTVVNSEKLPNKKKIFSCEGTCTVDEEMFIKLSQEKIHNVNERLDPKYRKYHDANIAELLAIYNSFEVEVECKSMIVKDEIISDDLTSALNQFAFKVKKDCEGVEYTWKYDIDDVEERIYSEIHDYGVYKSCKFHFPTIKCNEGL